MTNSFLQLQGVIRSPIKQSQMDDPTHAVGPFGGKCSLQELALGIASKKRSHKAYNEIYNTDQLKS
jgi:hypothetical protein